MVSYHWTKIASPATPDVDHRIQPRLYNADSNLDHTSSENLGKLENAGLENALAYNKKLDLIIDRLLGDSAPLN